MEFWKRIKYELKSHGLSQKELAEKLNLNIQTLRNSISLNRLPDLETGYKIAQELKQPLEYFMSGELSSSNNNPLPMREINMLENYRKLTESEKDAIDSAIKILAQSKNDNS